MLAGYQLRHGQASALHLVSHLQFPRCGAECRGAECPSYYLERVRPSTPNQSESAGQAVQADVDSLYVAGQVSDEASDGAVGGYTHFCGMVHGSIDAGDQVHVCCARPIGSSLLCSSYSSDRGACCYVRRGHGQRLEVSGAFVALCRVCRGRVRESEAIIKEQGTGETGSADASTVRSFVCLTSGFLVLQYVDILFNGALNALQHFWACLRTSGQPFCKRALQNVCWGPKPLSSRQDDVCVAQSLSLTSSS